MEKLIFFNLIYIFHKINVNTSFFLRRNYFRIAKGFQLESHNKEVENVPEGRCYLKGQDLSAILSRRNRYAEFSGCLRESVERAYHERRGIRHQGIYSPAQRGG